MQAGPSQVCNKQFSQSKQREHPRNKYEVMDKSAGVTPLPWVSPFNHDAQAEAVPLRRKFFNTGTRTF